MRGKVSKILMFKFITTLVVLDSTWDFVEHILREGIRGRIEIKTKIKTYKKTNYGS